MPHIAERLNNLPPYVFAVTGQRIQQMRSGGLDVISLDIGSPDLPPPQPVIDELARSANNPHNHGYTGYRGIPAFRKAVADYYRDRFGVILDPEREVLPLLGSKEGIINLSLAYLDRGDIALVPDIAYPSYAMGARLAGADISWLPLSAENYYRVDISSVSKEMANRAKLLWVNYPNNPTGAVVDLEYYDTIVDFCLEHDIVLGSDNPYVDVTYDGYIAPSVLQSPHARDCCVEFMSFSKTYNMGGWRLGAAVGNSEALKILLQVKSNVDSGHFYPIYEAGVVAIEETSRSWIDKRNRVYQGRRDRILEKLPAIGLEASKSAGSLYVWAHVMECDGTIYAHDALEQALVSITPGSTYGSGGEQYVRISLGIPDDRLDVALERLQTWYSSRIAQQL